MRRRVLITGAGSGLGQALAHRYAGTGARVACVDLDATRAELTRAALPGDGHLAIVANVGSDESMEQVHERVAGEWGGLDVLVNNAGIAIDRGQFAASPDFERVRSALDTNLLGAWRCCAAAVPEMKKNGYGRIVNISSHLGSLATMGDTNVSYRVSKAALNALTRVLAAELAGTGILVNACSPGRMNTRMAYGETDRTPEEGADTPVWLATLPPDGPTGGLFADRMPIDW